MLTMKQKEKVRYMSICAIKLFHICMEHQQALIELFQTKFVQTIEVQRARYLYPIFSEIASAVNKPLTLKFGTSVGLLLH